MTHQDIINLLIAAACSVTGSLFALWLVGRGAKEVSAFYAQADEIEAMIKNGEDFAIVMEKLLRLSDKSFHRSTGGRIRELAKMMEVKYDKKILQNP